eukprot:jgi/Mesvir1/8642/Mv02586-RA.1
MATPSPAIQGSSFSAICHATRSTTSSASANGMYGGLWRRASATLIQERPGSQGKSVARVPLAAPPVHVRTGTHQGVVVLTGKVVIVVCSGGQQAAVKGIR